MQNKYVAIYIIIKTESGPLVEVTGQNPPGQYPPGQNPPRTKSPYTTAAIGLKFQLTLIQKRLGRDIYQSLAHNVRNMNPVDAILTSWDEMSDGGLK